MKISVIFLITFNTFNSVQVTTRLYSYVTFLLTFSINPCTQYSNKFNLAKEVHHNTECTPNLKANHSVKPSCSHYVPKWESESGIGINEGLVI